MPNLIVSCAFNPPVLIIMGHTLREETIRRLDARLTQMTTTFPSSKAETAKFELRSDPPHWYSTLDGQYCDQLGRSLVFMTIIEALEAEGWKLRASNTVSDEELVLDISKLFFFKEKDH
eukprot:EG_transcript_30979